MLRLLTEGRTYGDACTTIHIWCGWPARLHFLHERLRSMSRHLRVHSTIHECGYRFVDCS